MLKGSCCCKKITFEITDQPVVMGTCHCTRCRKVGASTILLIKKGSLVINSGKELIATYLPEEGYKYNRNFCINCGTALGELASDDEMFPIPANAIDSDIQLEITFHEFVSEKPKWYEICDTAKQFAGHPL